MTCRVAEFTTATGIDHVVFTESGRSLQLAVTSADHPLMVEALPDPAIARHWRRSLDRLDDLRRTGSLRPALYPPDPRGRRHAHVLQALDGWLADLPLRDIAAAIFGRQRVDRDWRDPDGTLRDQVRRAVARGRRLMQGGYRALLA